MRLMLEDLLTEVKVLDAILLDYDQNKAGNKLLTELSDKKIIFTGTLGNYSRKQAEDISRNLGAIVASKFTKDIDILVVSESSVTSNPSSKYDKALKYGITIFQCNV